MEYVGQLGGVIAQHAEEPRLTVGAVAHEGPNAARLGLAGWEQAIHTPPLALATMLHRETVLLHGADDAWAGPEESELLAAVLAEAGNQPGLTIAPGGHDLAEAGDEVIGEFASALVTRMQPRELPPVLLAIEQMGGSG